jgi:hypothetical protein
MTRFGLTFRTGVALIAMAGATHVSAQTSTGQTSTGRTSAAQTITPPVVALPSLPDMAPLAGLADLSQLATLPQQLGDLSQLADLPMRVDMRVDVPSAVDLHKVQVALDELKIHTGDLEGLHKLRELPILLKADRLAFAASRGDDQDQASDEARRQADQKRRDAEEARRASERESNRNNRYNRCAASTEGDNLYDCGRDALDDSRWDRAAEFFGKSAAAKGARADAALYWKAYAQNKLGQRAEALATIGELKSGYAKSRWLNDASALEVETRQSTSQRVTPDAAVDDDLRLLALQNIGNSPEAVPFLDKMLAGTASPKLKDKALFMLAQNDNPQARAVIGKIAKGGANPELQMRALRYLGMFRTAESRQMLDEVYRGSADPEVKKQILRSYMTSGDRERVLAAARTETNQELRLEAVRQLSVMKAPDELSALYAQETSLEVKQQILRGLGIGGNADKLFAIAQTEKTPELRRTAIRNIGLIRKPELAGQLTALYAKETDPDVKKAAIEALFLQQNAGALVTLARQEKDPEMKKTIVSRLATMRESAEARDYMLELLK